ncbi:biotin transporter BioY [Thermaerobacter sp. PB12/4term]|uniref:biotin transporter BioY n=1 Tax=Thermaerobacter sp. PB12/4term TaxID=2293838 RepID=UPI000E329BC7|nr:biotin transporter BioY [Thermaerobacter sp. PB12/4term]QIA26540.1 biotin transporter BioY [Thermaerobacter sp. PB12/4term]
MPSQPPLDAPDRGARAAPAGSPAGEAAGPAPLAGPAHPTRLAAGGSRTGDLAAASGSTAATLRPLVLAGLMAGLTAVLSYLRIPLPFTPVPITGQTLGVMLSGLLLGPRWGFAAQLAYLLLGVAGVPVFAGGAAGLAVVLGPTGGFLMSYPLAAGLTGLLSRPGAARRPGPASGGQGARGGERAWPPAGAAYPAPVPGMGRAFLASVAGGILLVYAIGAPWLAVVTGTPWPGVATAAVLPFVPGDLAKALVAAWLAPRVLRALGGRLAPGI